MTFTPRLTRPEAGNKYYIRTVSGGWNPSIAGKPTDSMCDVLSNCVGYAVGRFNEIGGYGSCKYMKPVNAEMFVNYTGGLTTGSVPKVGACMVWRKGATLDGSDGAGHVAIVEQMNADGSIVTSESGWGCDPFWTQRRTNANGNWGAGAGYTFLCFIYQPEGVRLPDVPTGDGLTVDGLWGPATTKRLQEIFGLEVTGLVRGQIMDYRSLNPGLRSGWQWLDRSVAQGDALIKALQQWAGLTGDAVDGLLGYDTIRALQRKLGTHPDGIVSRPSKMVKALQQWCNTQ